MQITANGKNIDTHPIKNLLIQGEKLSETVTFTVDRFYNGNDLSLCSFFIRGVTDKNEEAQQGLITQISEEKITLIWKISEFFTATAGTLRLEIRAVLLSETDESETLVLKYDMPPIFIKPSPVGSSSPPRKPTLWAVWVQLSASTWLRHAPFPLSATASTMSSAVPARLLRFWKPTASLPRRSQSAPRRLLL